MTSAFNGADLATQALLRENGLGPSSFDPDDTSVPVYDDRAPRVERTPDPVVQRRNRGNRQRGKSAERLWTALINEDASDKAIKRGVLGGADVTWGPYAFEVKHKHMGWPSNTVVKNALVQAARNAGNRTPVVVCCMTTHNSRSWRVYSAVGVYVDGKDWLRDELLSEAQKAEGAA